MKKIIFSGTLMFALLTMLSLQSCNSEKKTETSDSTVVDTTMSDSATVMPPDTTVVDTGMKGTKVPTPKN